MVVNDPHPTMRAEQLAFAEIEGVVMAYDGRDDSDGQMTSLWQEAAPQSFRFWLGCKCFPLQL